MSLITPTGTITLYKNVPLNANYAHSIHFSGNEQASYFNGKKLTNGTLTAQNYVKSENGKIRVQITEPSINIDNASYMSWKNTDAGNNFEDTLTFYAFIKNVDMISINVVEITYEIDVLQTYVIQGEVTFKNCLIERWTPADDAKYSHLEPEPLGFGEYKVSKLSSLIVDTSWKWVVFAPFDVSNPPDVSSFDPFENISYPVKMNGMAGGVLQGLWSYAYDSYNDMKSDIEDMDSRLAEQIVGIVAMPAGFITSGSLGVIQPNVKDEGTSLPPNIDGYTPSYNKLWASPFNTMLLSTTSGDTRELKFEYFQDPSHISFHLALGISANPIMMCCPNYYGHGFVAGNKPNYLEAVNISDFPHVAWTGDGFKAWFATTGQHAITNTIGSIASGIVSGILNPATIPGSVGGLLSGVAGSMIDMANAGVTKNKSYGNTGGPVALMPDNAVNFYVYQQCVNNKDAKRIDQYFDMFGYAVNKIDTPGHSIVASRNHRYVKTVGCMVEGSCPAEYLRKIENIFNSGITWWDKDNIGNYPTGN